MQEDRAQLALPVSSKAGAAVVPWCCDSVPVGCYVGFTLGMPVKSVPFSHSESSRFSVCCSLFCEYSIAHIAVFSFWDEELFKIFVLNYSRSDLEWLQS